MAPPDLTPERIVRLEGDAVVLLDQRRLPDEELELWCVSAEDVADASRRGEDLDTAYDVLAAARPTAVNLRWALDEMRDDPTPERARALHEAEVGRCRAMGAHAVALVSAGSRLLTHCNTGALATGGYGSA